MMVIGRYFMLVCFVHFGMGMALGQVSRSDDAVSQQRMSHDSLAIISGKTVQALVVDGDTLPLIELQPVMIFASRHFSSRWEQRRYQRLVYNIKRVYPYARLAGLKLHEYNEELSRIESEAKRRKFLKNVEQEIREEFEADLMRLNRTQGMILIKLIDRETSHTSYDLLKDFRGAFSAVFWQSLGRLFGYNLKIPYDPDGEDRLIEEIVVMIEAGAL